MGLLVTRVICQRHGFSATVGRGVQFALDYYECPECVREQDEEYAASFRPCCSRANVDCVGHDDYDFNGPMWSVEILSPDFCDHIDYPGHCLVADCKHAECNEVPF